MREVVLIPNYHYDNLKESNNDTNILGLKNNTGNNLRKGHPKSNRKLSKIYSVEHRAKHKSSNQNSVSNQSSSRNEESNFRNSSKSVLKSRLKNRDCYSPRGRLTSNKMSSDKLHKNGKECILTKYNRGSTHLSENYRFKIVSNSDDAVSQLTNVEYEDNKVFSSNPDKDQISSKSAVDQRIKIDDYLTTITPATNRDDVDTIKDSSYCTGIFDRSSKTNTVENLIRKSKERNKSESTNKSCNNKGLKDILKSDSFRSDSRRSTRSNSSRSYGLKILNEKLSDINFSNDNRRSRSTRSIERKCKYDRNVEENRQFLDNLQEEKTLLRKRRNKKLNINFSNDNRKSRSTRSIERRFSSDKHVEDNRQFLDNLREEKTSLRKRREENNSEGTDKSCNNKEHMIGISPSNSYHNDSRRSTRSNSSLPSLQNVSSDWNFVAVYVTAKLLDDGWSQIAVEAVMTAILEVGESKELCKSIILEAAANTITALVSGSIGKKENHYIENNESTDFEQRKCNSLNNNYANVNGSTTPVQYHAEPPRGILRNYVGSYGKRNEEYSSVTKHEVDSTTSSCNYEDSISMHSSGVYLYQDSASSSFSGRMNTVMDWFTCGFMEDEQNAEDIDIKNQISYKQHGIPETIPGYENSCCSYCAFADDINERTAKVTNINNEINNNQKRNPLEVSEDFFLNRIESRVRQ